MCVCVRVPAKASHEFMFHRQHRLLEAPWQNIGIHIRLGRRSPHSHPLARNDFRACFREQIAFSRARYIVSSSESSFYRLPNCCGARALVLVMPTKSARSDKNKMKPTRWTSYFLLFCRDSACTATSSLTASSNRVRDWSTLRRIPAPTNRVQIFQWDCCGSSGGIVAAATAPSPTSNQLWKRNEEIAKWKRKML